MTRAPPLTPFSSLTLYPAADVCICGDTGVDREPPLQAQIIRRGVRWCRLNRGVKPTKTASEVMNGREHVWASSLGARRRGGGRVIASMST